MSQVEVADLKQVRSLLEKEQAKTRKLEGELQDKTTSYRKEIT